MSEQLTEKIRRVQAYREGGAVQRCHTMPILGDASNARHQYNMVVLYFLLHPNPLIEVVHHILVHDVAERWVGDTPAPAKHSMNPQLGKELLKAEQWVEQALGIPELVDAGERKWVKALDLLELLMFCEDQLALGNRNVTLTGRNCRVLLQGHWVPQVVREFAAAYTWSRTEDIVKGEVMHEIGSGLR